MVEKNPRSDGEYLNSLARGLAVLRSFSKDHPQMTLSEVADITGLNPAVVRRCLNTLMHLGYIGKAGKHFLLRPEVFALGTAYSESMNLEELIRPTLQEIRDKTGFSTALGILSNQDIMFLVYVSTRMLTRVAAGVGTRFPAYATASGRALLANQSEDWITRYVANATLSSLTPNTVSDHKQLVNILAEVKREGFAMTTGELDFGIISVAVPVFSPDGRAVASISCSSAMMATDAHSLRQNTVPLLRHAADNVEVELRRHPTLVHSLSGEVEPA